MFRHAETLERYLYNARLPILWCGWAVTCALLFFRASDADNLNYPIKDLLINYADGVIRRGLSGEMARGLAAVFGGTPSLWAWAIVTVVSAVLVFFCGRVFRRLPEDARYLPLVLAPFGFLFFAYDPQGSLRKELFGFLAIAVMLQGALSGGGRAVLGWALTGCAVFLVTLFVHEAIIFLWPVFALGAWVVSDRHRSLRKALFWMILITGAFGALVILYLSVLPPRDVSVMCAAVGFGACDGPFEALNSSISEGWSYVYRRRDYGEVAVYVVLSVICAVPFAGLHRQGMPVVVKVALLTLPFVAIFPLFFVGYDWGRWIQMAFFPLSLVVCAGVVTGSMTYRRILPAALAVVYVSTWNIPHASGQIEFYALFLWPVFVAISVMLLAAGKIRGQDTRF